MRSPYFIPAMFIIAWLLSLALSVLRKRAQNEAQQEVDPKAMSTSTRELSAPILLPLGGRVPGDRPLPVVVPLVDRHPQTFSRLGSSQEVRRGMVLMTILGPCRALEPPELPQ